jgi:hypothetical protein
LAVRGVCGRRLDRGWRGFRSWRGQILSGIFRRLVVDDRCKHDDDRYYGKYETSHIRCLLANGQKILRATTRRKLKPSMRIRSNKRSRCGG